MAMAATIAGQPLPMAHGKPSASIVSPVKRKADVLEMLSYVHSLGIDHVRESEMLWIAEEAYNAPLPPGWTEHVDNEGRTYFYNTNLRESLWQHPLDEVFIQIANYWRRVVRQGGFWEVDEELAEIEEKIRADLSDWMELYDDAGNKFYFNRETEESLFDDPRHTTYHSLYTRIRLVNMMKEKLPLLAMAPRPTEPIVNNAEMLRQKKEAEDKVSRAVMRVQAAVRVMLARRKARAMAARRCLDRVPAQMKSKLRLKVRTAIPGTNVKEVVLAVTTPHKRHRAATKLQAQMRRFLEQKKFRPMRDHRRYMILNATKIQKVAKKWLAGRWEREAEKRRRAWAVLKIQCWARGIAARKVYAEKKQERDDFKKMCRVVLKMQTNLRRWIAKVEVGSIRVKKYTPPVDTLQRAIKVFQAKRHMVRLMQEQQPVQCFFQVTEGQKAAHLMPWVWRLGMLPVGEDGKPIDVEEVKKRNELKLKRAKRSILKRQTGTEEEKLEELPVAHDLFAKVGVGSLEDAAAIEIQRVMKGVIRWKRFRKALDTSRSFAGYIVKAAAEEMVARRAAAPKIQTIFRGFMIRKQNLIQQKKKAFFMARLEQISTASKYFRRFDQQDKLFEFIHLCKLHDAATLVQKRWRGMIARRHVVKLEEEAAWPLKGWFEYTGMGRDAVQMSIKFLPNPSFDAYRHHKKHGKTQTLLERIQDMQKEIDSCLMTYMGPEEFAAYQAERAAEDAAKQSAQDAEKEEREVDAMAREEEICWSVEVVVRAEEAEKRAEEERIRAEEQARREEEEALEAARLAEEQAAEEAARAAEEAREAALRAERGEDEDVVGSEQAGEDAEGQEEETEQQEPSAEAAEGTEDVTAETDQTRPLEEMDVTAPLLDQTSPDAAEAGHAEGDGGEALPDKGNSLDSGGAYKVLSEAAAEVSGKPRSSPGRSEGASHRSKGSRRGAGSNRSKTSKKSQEPSPPPPPVMPGEPKMEEDPLDRLKVPSKEKPPARGKPRWNIRPGLVDMAALNKLQKSKEEVRLRRMRIGDHQRDQHPIPSQQEYMNPNRTQPMNRMLHRHVHHHVHYHGGTDQQPGFFTGIDGAATAYPQRMTSGQPMLEPIAYNPSQPSLRSNSKGSNSSMGRSKSDTQVRLEPLQPAGPAGPALRSGRSFAEEDLDGGASGYLPQQNLHALGATDGMLTPTRGSRRPSAA